jgi:tetratricopeptide (TPR) repeat protein
VSARGADGPREALLPVPGLSIHPLHPAGWFPPPERPEAAVLSEGDAAPAGDTAAAARPDPFGAAVAPVAARGIAGDPAGALEALGRAGDAPDDASRAVSEANRSAAFLALGELERAERAAAGAVRAGRRARSDAAEAAGQLAAALARLARGGRGEARARLGEAVRGFARSGDRLRQVQCHHLLGEIAWEAEDPIRAGAHYRNALALAREGGMDAAVEVLTLRFEHR